MKGMKERNTFYIITSLLSAALIIPGIVQYSQFNSIILNEQTLTGSILKSLPLLLLLLFVSLYASPTDRKERGWHQPEWTDIPIILLFLILTGILSIVFPGTEGSYTVQINGLKGYLLSICFAFTAAFTEELFFRSWLVSGLRKSSWPEWLVFLIPVMFFSILHLWQGWSGLIFAGISGAVYTFYFMKRPGLFVLVASHTIHNALAIIMMSGK